ncbi:MAG: DUF5060 domain-containing protein [Bacteroidota bacterium]
MSLPLISVGQLDKAIIDASVVFTGENDLIAVEAEHFYKQTAKEVRAWYRHSAQESPHAGLDTDPQHLAGASNHAYLEILPDTRTTHDDPIKAGLNFMNEAGKMAVLHYKVQIKTAGRYYVWVRTFSTGSEDNGLHVGIDGTWPEHGQRMQWTTKHRWYWANKQRTKEVHVGVPMEIYLDIAEAGEHEIMFSMREDGFEFDKFILVRDKDFRPKQDQGPAPSLYAGSSLPVFSPSPNAHSSIIDGPDGSGKIEIKGELQQWHKVSLVLDGPFAREDDDDPNPFTDYRMDVRFTHESGSPSYKVAGYFAADGNGAESSAIAGTKWIAHLSPDKAGRWDYEVSFHAGENIAILEVPWAEALAPYHGIKGSFAIQESDKSGRDFRAHGRLTYVGKRYLQFAGSGEYFFKAGADAPETFLAYDQFDGTYTAKMPLKTWEPHLQDWQDGDPLWQKDKGKTIIGALNYLAAKEVNAFSFLTYNAGGDGDNVWPFVQREDKYHYDCSKLAQWQIVFDHAQKLGLHCHFKLQETENDDNRRKGMDRVIPSLDGGKLGPQRRLYYREMIARFGYLLALNWNIGEESTHTTEEQQQIASFFTENDPYQHNLVLHTYPNQQEKVYTPLLGDASTLTGASLQNQWNAAHRWTLHWVEASAKAGRQWVVANDEQGSAGLGTPPDPDYPSFDASSIDYDLHDIRKQTLWGNLMAGGAGVEYYFGYKLPENDLFCEDYRSRDQSWDYAAHAIRFFNESGLAFHEMANQNALIGNPENKKDAYCLAKENEVYLVYLAYTEEVALDLSQTKGTFELQWFNPRTGEIWPKSRTVKGGKSVRLRPPTERGEDWLAILKRQ